MTSTFILVPSKTFKQCFAQPCIYSVMPGLDECIKHCYHISWKSLAYGDETGLLPNWKRQCSDCGLFSLIGGSDDWYDSPDPIVCPHPNINSNYWLNGKQVTACRLCGEHWDGENG